MANVKLAVVYYSSTGTIHGMAERIAQAGEKAGAEVRLRQVPELAPPEAIASNAAWSQHFDRTKDEPKATADDVVWADAVLFGTPTRYGNMAAQMRNFLDQTGSLWLSGALVGKVGSVFTSTATQHGGQESTLLTFHPTLLHLGMIVVGLPYTAQEQMGLDEIQGGSPYGASTIAGGKGERMPNEAELKMARFQGRHVATIAARLCGPKGA